MDDIIKKVKQYAAMVNDSGKRVFSNRKIAELIGIDRAIVANIIKDKPVKLDKLKCNVVPVNEIEIREMYEQGYSPAQISQLRHIGHNRVMDIIKDLYEARHANKRRTNEYLTQKNIDDAAMHYNKVTEQYKKLKPGDTVEISRKYYKNQRSRETIKCTVIAKYQHHFTVMLPTGTTENFSVNALMVTKRSEPVLINL